MGRIQTRTKVHQVTESRTRHKAARKKHLIGNRLSNFRRPAVLAPVAKLPARRSTKDSKPKSIKLKDTKKSKASSQVCLPTPKNTEDSKAVSTTTTTTSVITVISTNTTSCSSGSTSQQQVSISMFQRQENVQVAVKAEAAATEGGATERKKSATVVQHLKHVADIIEYVASGKSVQAQQPKKDKRKILCLRSRSIKTEASQASSSSSTSTSSRNNSNSKKVIKTRKKSTPKTSCRLKRKRVAGLNASAKVHCLLENEFRRIQPGSADFNSDDSNTDDSSESDSGEESAESCKPKSRKSPSSNKRRKDTIAGKTQKSKKLPVRKKVKQKRKKRASMEVVALDALDVVVPKRMASLNASAILAVTSQWDRPQRQRTRSETGDTSKDEDYNPPVQYRPKQQKKESPVPSSPSPLPSESPSPLRVSSFKSDFRCAVEVVAASHSYQVSSSSSSSSGDDSATGSQREAVRNTDVESKAGPAQYYPEMQSTSVGSYSPLGALYNMKPPVNQQQQQSRSDSANGLVTKEEKAFPLREKPRPLDDHIETSANPGAAAGASSSAKLRSTSPSSRLLRNSPLTPSERPASVNSSALGSAYSLYRPPPLLVDRPLEPFLTCYPSSAYAGAAAALTDPSHHYPYAYHRAFPFLPHLNPAGYVPIPLADGYAGYPGPPPAPPLPPPPLPGTQELHPFYALHRIPLPPSCYPRLLPTIPYPSEWRTTGAASVSSTPAGSSMHGDRSILPLTGLEASKSEASQLLLTAAPAYCADRAQRLGYSASSDRCLGINCSCSGHTSVPCPKNAQAGPLTGEAKRSGPNMTTATVVPHASPVSLGRPTSGSTTSPAVPCVPPELPCSSATELLQQAGRPDTPTRKRKLDRSPSPLLIITKKPYKASSEEPIADENLEKVTAEPVASRLRSRLSSGSSESVLDSSLSSPNCCVKVKKKALRASNTKTDDVKQAAGVKSEVLEVINKKPSVKSNNKKHRKNSHNNNNNSNNNNYNNRVVKTQQEPVKRKEKLSNKTADSKKSKKNSLVERLKIDTSLRTKQVTVDSPPVSPDGSAGKPRWSNGWTWEGRGFDAAVYLRNDEAPVIRRCYPAMRHAGGDVVRVRDCLLLKSGSRAKDLPFIAKVAALWEDVEDGEMKMSLLWYYRPEHTDHGRRSCDLEMEVFASRHRDVCSVACVEDICYVLTFNEYCRYRKEVKMLEEGIQSASVSSVPSDVADYPRRRQLPPPSLPPDRVFLCRKVYDFRQKRILKNPT